MDAFLTRMHGAMAIQGQMINTGPILALYELQQTKPWEQEDSSLAAEMQ